MQNNPSYNNDNRTQSGAPNSDVLSAIAAAAAAAEDIEDPTVDTAGETTSAVTNVETSSVDKAEEKAETFKVHHDHRGAICSEEYDAMLNQALIDREAMLVRKKRTRRIATAAVFLITCGSAAGWYASSPDNKAKVHGLWDGAVAITEDVKEGTDVVAIMDKYDAALDKIDARQETITDAAIQLGVDPDSVTAKSQAQLDEAMKKITGDAPTVAQRDALLKERFGNMAEKARKDIEAKRAEQQAQGK